MDAIIIDLAIKDTSKFPETGFNLDNVDDPDH